MANKSHQEACHQISLPNRGMMQVVAKLCRSVILAESASQVGLLVDTFVSSTRASSLTCVRLSQGVNRRTFAKYGMRDSYTRVAMFPDHHVFVQS